MKNKSDRVQRKNLKLLDAITIVIGMVIGSGIFFKPSEVIKSAGSPLFAIIAWIIGGAVAIASGLTIAEIASAIPKTGGIFAFLKELYGEKWAFLFGWIQSLVYIPGVLAALGIVFATEMSNLIPMNSFEKTLMAMAVIIFLCIIISLSTKAGGAVQKIFTISKLIPIAIIIILGFTKDTIGSNVLSTGSGINVTGLGAAVLGTLWAYDGWANVANLGDEIENPRKNLPKAIILGLSLTIVVYVVFNMAIIKILPMDVLLTSDKPATDAAIALIGVGGAKLISVGILISIFGTINGYMITGARVPYAMAKEGYLPFSKKLSIMDEKFNTPINSTITMCLLALIYILSGSFNLLTNLVTFVMWIFFIMTVAGVFILRKKKSLNNDGYRVPFYPVVPLIAIIGGAYIIISSFIANPIYAVVGILIGIIGLPVFYHLKKGKDKEELVA